MNERSYADVVDILKRYEEFPWIHLRTIGEKNWHDTTYDAPQECTLIWRCSGLILKHYEEFVTGESQEAAVPTDGMSFHIAGDQLTR